MNATLNTVLHSEASVFDALAPEWNALLHASRSDAPFLTHEWQTAFWRTLGEGALRLAAARAVDGGLAGIAPLYLAPAAGGTSLRLIGGVDPSDYLDLILMRDREAQVGGAILDALSALDDWDRIDLYNIADDSPTRRWLPAAAAARGWACLDEQQVVSPVLNLPDSFEAYLAGLSRRERHELRRKLRRADAMEGLRWYVVDSEFVNELEPEVDAFLELMMRSRPDKAEFMTPAMRQFFYAGVRAAHRGGWLQLAFLEREGRKAATYLSFDYNNRLYVYNSGYDPDAAGGFSPGIVLIARIIEQAIRQGRQGVDFMRGDEDYKYRLGATDRWVHHLTVDRASRR